MGAPSEFTEGHVPVPDRDEVLVRVACCGLCHTDLAVMAYEPGDVIPPP